MNFFKQKRLLSLIFSVLFINLTFSQSADLFFSEYIEGSSYNKAIEIYNGNSTTVSLNNYRIAKTSNGSDWNSFHQFPGGATMASGDVWIIIADQLDTAFFDHANADEILSYPSPVHYNGDDAIAILKISGTDTIFIDVIGVPAVTISGDGWDVAGVSEATKDHTLIRKSNILMGNIDWNLSAGTDASNSEWIVESENYFGNLGSHNVGGNMAPVVSDVLSISETFVIEAPLENVAFYLGASISDFDGSIASAQLSWGTDGIIYPNQIVMDTFSLASGLPSDFYCTYTTLIPGQLAGTIIYYQIVAIDDEPDTTIVSGSVTVMNASGTTSIYDIQFTTDPSGDSPLLGSIVTTSGIVTAAGTGNYFLQDGAGAWNGVFVYDSSYPVSIGDSITITCEVAEYYDITELKNLTDFTLHSQNNTLPAASLVSLSDFVEDYESVLIRVENVTCTNDNLGYGEWEISDGANTGVVNDLFYVFTPNIGTAYNVTGPLNYNFSVFKIEPRDANDIEMGVLSSASDILSFDITEQIAPATIDTANHTVSLEVLNGTSLTSLSPIISVSPGASINPSSGVAQDFSNVVVYTVTAQDASTQDWNVTVTEAALSTETDILSFEMNEQAGAATIDMQNHTVEIEVVFGTALISLSPTIAVSAGATISPISGVAQDFSSIVVYTVTAQDGTTLQDWNVNVTVAPQMMGDLFFSEYIEGSSNNKAMEIFNGTGTTVALDNYQIAQTSNGSDWTYFHTFPAGASIANGDVWVIMTDEVDIAYFSPADADEVLSFPSVVHFNGNDARALFKINGSDSIFLDYIGVPNLDPGNAWDVAGVTEATKDHTIIRKPYVLQGNLDWALSAGTDVNNSEWIVADQNTFTYLGWHNFGGNMPPIISDIMTITETFSFDPPQENDAVYIGAVIGDIDGMVDTAYLYWGTDGVNYPNLIEMSLFTLVPTLPPGTYSTYPNLIPGQSVGTTVYFQIVAIDNEPDTTIAYGSYTIPNNPVFTTIYDIQYTTDPSGISPYVDSIVTVNGIVTAYDSNLDGFFLQDGTGAWNGVYVYNPSNLPTTIGDEISLTGLVTEYYALTEIKEISNLTVNSSNNTMPAATVVTTSEMSSEEYEGVLVKLENVICSNLDLGYGEWEVTDNSGIAVVDDYFFLYAPTLNFEYHVTGPVYYNFEVFKIEPRDVNDIELVNQKIEIENNEISIFPNPVNSKLSINNIENIENLIITNSIGQQVVELSNLNSNQIDLSILPSGIYIIQLFNKDNLIFAQKFVKE
ncbi:MAG: T9SS type A sorting domain-containing protein [Bacteroidetes bacterium]|jgi:predicted extracellular nuclease|nr:T9SS type A sorting domain-containing protein [Bacteroidota bacterium]MBT7490689.1 T9SS type A sorting domain-containing protein [Bacteroidota bacterium]